MSRIKKAITAFAVVLGLTAGTCDTGEDTHPNAPQAPGPERGGPPAQQPREPNPGAGDPRPDIDEIKKRVQNDPNIAVMYVVWNGERMFRIEYTLEAGQVPKIEKVRPLSKQGGIWARTFSVHPGQTIGFSAFPRDMQRQAEGVAHCYLFHKSGKGDFIVDFHFVPRGPCAVSYTIPG